MGAARSVVRGGGGGGWGSLGRGGEQAAPRAVREAGVDISLVTVCAHISEECST